jgi:hypothetical protein
MIKRFVIKGFSKKFKGTQKLPAQKSPSRFSAMYSQKIADEKTRDVFGELPEFMGMSRKATGELAAESLALQTANKKFFRTLPKELARSRARTATGVKYIKQTKKIPKLAVFKAKQKGAMKAYGIATKKSEKAFRGTMETFTTKTKTSPFAQRSIKIKSKTMAQEPAKRMGIDDRDVSVLKSNQIRIKTIENGKLKFKTKRIGGSYTDYTETMSFDLFKKKKK